MAGVERRYVEDSEEGEKGGRRIGERLRLTLKPFHLLEMTLTKLDCNMCTVLYIYIYIFFVCLFVCLFFFSQNLDVRGEKEREAETPGSCAKTRSVKPTLKND